MRRVLFVLAAAFAAVWARADIPTSAEGWYTPDGGFQYDSWQASWSQGKKSGTCTVDPGGNVAWDGELPANDATRVALEMALEARINAYVNRESIATIGKNLNSIGLSSGIEVMAKDPNGGSHTYTLKFGKGTLQQTVNADGKITVEDPSSAYNHGDETSLHWTEKNKMEVYGWKGQANERGSMFNLQSGLDGYAMVMRTGKNGALAYVPWCGVDKLSLMPDARNQRLELNGWSTASASMTPLGEALAKKNKGTFEQYQLVVRNASKGLNYVDIGTLAVGGGAPVDGCSVTTNVADGAVSQGVASLYNWAAQTDYAIPYKYRSTLFWKTPDAWVDGASLAWEADGGENMRFAVKGAKDYAGKHAKHYFGTSNDKSAALGWHELPNATTNRVEGDEATISTNPNIPGRRPDPDVKMLGLRGWNYQYAGREPLCVVNNRGALDYVPILTNGMAACDCTNKWDGLCTWIGNGAERTDDGLALPGESMDRYICDTLGYVYSTTPANLHFDNDGDDLTASFSPPSNWADGKSVGVTSDRSGYEIKGWGSAVACSATVSKMLSEPTGSDAQKHMLVARYADDGALHYVPMGDGIAGGGADADGVTICTNTTQGAATQGLMSIYGWASAGNDTYLGKNASGQLEWMQAPASADDASITTNTAHGAVTSGIASLYGFADAPLGTVPIVANDNGTHVLRWGTIGNFGMTATKSGAGWTYTISYGYFTKARTQTGVSGITVSTSGYVYLKVPLGSGSASLVVESSTKSSDSSYTYILLYYCNVNSGVTDYRGAPQIQVWE